MIKPEIQVCLGHGSSRWLAGFNLGDFIGQIFGCTGIKRGEPATRNLACGCLTIKHGQQSGFADISITKEADPLGAGQAMFDGVQVVRPFTGTTHVPLPCRQMPTLLTIVNFTYNHYRPTVGAIASDTDNEPARLCGLRRAVKIGSFKRSGSGIQSIYFHHSIHFLRHIIIALQFWPECGDGLREVHEVSMDPWIDRL